MTEEANPVAEVRRRMRQFGMVPKCWAAMRATMRAGLPESAWLMVYENPFAPMSARHFIGLWENGVEVMRTPYVTERAARTDFERKASV